VRLDPPPLAPAAVPLLLDPVPVLLPAPDVPVLEPPPDVPPLALPPDPLDAMLELCRHPVSVTSCPPDRELWLLLPCEPDPPDPDVPVEPPCDPAEPPCCAPTETASAADRIVPKIICRFISEPPMCQSPTPGVVQAGDQ